jgi:predicted membrane-bound spermidine synthase
MFGLFGGSWLAGKTIVPLTAKTGRSAIWYYALAELMIGVGAFAVPKLLGWGESWLLPAGETDSFFYLLWSALILAFTIVPWCIFMGATFPLMMQFVREQDESASTSFSFLYLANVIGAMAGTLTTALVLVELLGLSRTLFFAAAVNVAIAISAGLLGWKFPRPARTAPPEEEAGRQQATLSLGGGRLIAVVLFTTGFTSMGMEVAWTRAFTPVLQTQVYSFAALLFVYLLATSVGSLRYRRHLAEGRVVATPRLVTWIAIAAACPVALNDPRLLRSLEGWVGENGVEAMQAAVALLSIVPFCALLGYLTPKLIDRYSTGKPEAAGVSYAVNVLGCILGPLFASYLLLPLLGIKYTLLLLAAPYPLLLVAYAPRLRRPQSPNQAYAGVGLLLLCVFLSQTYEDRVSGSSQAGFIERDHTATVIAYGSGMQKRLLVNGRSMTHFTTITKVMAHLPLGLVKRPPRSALVICLGMGTTFRSLMSWNVHATAVELVPSVKDAFGYFFSDAKEIASRPEGKIIIDDGRRFLRRTSETFDVITIDPPPPVEAAASSLLYSKEFYAAAIARLSEGGILQQWIPDTEDRIVQAVARSLLEAFPHVKMYRSFEGWGYHFLASMQPIDVPPPAVLAARLPARAVDDLLEWTEAKDPVKFLAQVLAGETNPYAFARGNDARVTDDRPYNEYYMLRRVLVRTSLKRQAALNH